MFLAFQKFGLNGTCYRGKYDCLNWKSKNIDQNDLFDLASTKLEDIANIIIKTRRVAHEFIVLDKSGINETAIRMLEQRSQNYGKCYTLRFKKSIRNLIISSVTIRLVTLKLKCRYVIDCNEIEMTTPFLSSRKGKNEEDAFVSLHNANAFYQNDMSSDFELADFSKQYYVDYQVKQALEQMKEDKLTCKREYNFDTECVYNKFQEIQEITSTECTVPWAKNNTNICSDPKDARMALSMAEHITSVGLQDCPNWCQSMPMKFSGGPAKGGISSSLTFHF